MVLGQVEMVGVSFFMNWKITVDPVSGVWVYLPSPDDLFPGGATPVGAHGLGTYVHLG